MSDTEKIVERLQNEVNAAIKNLSIEDAIDVVQELSSFLDAVESGLEDDQGMNEDDDSWQEEDE